MTLLRPTFFIALFSMFALPAVAASCPTQGVGIQVLGSGGTRIDADRASSGFLVRQDGHAIILVNIGGGAALRFAQSDARIGDLQAILITNVQADSTAALPALVQMSINEHRESPLPLYGPGRYKTIPSTVALIRALFEVSGGAYRELGKVLSPLETGEFKLRPRNIDIHFKDDKPLFDNNQTRVTVLHHDSLRLSAAPVDRGGIPALAWRVDTGDKSVVFAGMPMGKTDHLLQLARRADALVIAVPLGNEKSMSLEDIARLAKISGVKKLILTNLTAKTVESEKSIKKRVGKIYGGKILFAADLACMPL